MKRLSLAVAVVLSITTFANAQPSNKPSPSTPVTVVNTPLSVQGTVNVGNFPTPAAASVPFQKMLQSGFTTSFTVPSTDRLVIEYVSFSCSALGSDPELFAIGLETTASGQYGMHYFAPIKTAFSSSEGPAGTTRFAGGMQTRIYADPGTAVSYFYNSPGGLSVGCAVTVSGSLMPE